MHTRREINYFTNYKNEAQKNAGYCLVLFCFALLLLSPFSVHLLNATPALLCLPTLGLVLGTSQLAVSFLQSKGMEGKKTPNLVSLVMVPTVSTWHCSDSSQLEWTLTDAVASEALEQQNRITLVKLDGIVGLYWYWFC